MTTDARKKLDAMTSTTSWMNRFKKTSSRNLTFDMGPTARDAYDRVRGVEPEPDTKLPPAQRPAPTTIKEAEQRFVGAVTEWPSFVRETFGRLYRPADADDKPVPAKQVEPWAARAHAALEAQADWSELRSLARSHRAVAAAATAKLSSAVGGHLGLASLTQDVDAALDPEQQKARVQQLARLVELSAKQDMAAATSMRDDAKAAGDGWAQALTRRKVIADRAATVSMPALGTLVAATLAEARELASSITFVKSLFAGVGAGSDLVDGEVPMHLVELLRKGDLLKRVLELLGKINDANKKAFVDKLGKGRLDVVGVEAGNDVLKLVGSEVALLGRSDTRVDVIRRLGERSAMVREQIGERERIKGDFVMLVDRSGSMAGNGIIMARAIGIAMMLDAVKQGRRVVLVMFDDGARKPVVVDVGGRGLSAAMAELMLEPAGGTDAVGAMSQARSALSTKAKSRVDTVIITDGEWRDPTEAQRQGLRQAGGQFHEIRIIDGVGTGSNEALLARHPWMDSVTVVDAAGAATGSIEAATVLRTHARTLR